MIEIIPIEKDLFTSITKPQLENIKYNNIYCVDINLISILIKEENYPIKKELCIERILKLLQYIDSMLKNDNTLNISSLKIKEIMGKEYKSYMNILKYNKILTDIPNENGTFYTKTVCSKRYTFYNEFRNSDDLCLVYFDNKHSVKKIIDESINDLNIDKRFINTVINKLSVNYTKALKDEIYNWVTIQYPNEKLRRRLSNLFSSKHKRYIKKGNNVDRVYHSFSNLSRISREHLTINMCNIDLKNSQPLFLCLYLMDNGYDVDRMYKLDCESGTIYEKFYNTREEDYTEDIEDLRKIVKERIYKNIFFGFDDRSMYNKKFRELYPKTWLSIKYIKENDVSLAELLQNKESSLFNYLVPKKSKYFFTLFDAIYFSDSSDAAELSFKIHEFFDKKGIKSRIDTKIK